MPLTSSSAPTASSFHLEPLLRLPCDSAAVAGCHIDTSDYPPRPLALLSTAFYSVQPDITLYHRQVVPILL